MEEEEQRSLESFLRWAAQLGISDSTTTDKPPQHSHSCLGSSLFVSHFPHTGGRGLGAVRDLRRGELILRVPKSALMTSESVMEDKKLCVAVNRHSSLSSTQVDEAIWVTENAVLKTKSEWKEARALMEELVLKPQLLTFKAWVWAAATISSRTLHIPWDEAGCLCPVGDLFNYDAPGEEPSGIGDVENLLSNSSIDVSSSYGDSTIMVDADQLDSQSLRLTDGGFEEDVNAYCFYARAHYKKGDQVMLCYGTHSNLELLEHYGFLLHDNTNDKFFIPLEPTIYSSTSWSKESLYIHHDGKPSFALLAALRLWATPQIKRRSIAHLAYSGSQISIDNETYIMKWLSKTSHTVLKNLPTSIDEDTLLLNAMDNSQDFCTFMEITKLMSCRDEVDTFLEAYNMKDTCSFSNMILSRKARRAMDRWKLAVQWRIKYKKVLVDCITDCNQILDSLMK